MNINIVFDGPPGPWGGRFVEVENVKGWSISAGRWFERPDALWQLEIRDEDFNEEDRVVGAGISPKAAAVVLGEEARARSLRSGDIQSVPKRSPSYAGRNDGSPAEAAEDYNFLASSLEEAVSLLNDLIKSIWTQGDIPWGSDYSNTIGDLMARSMILQTKVGLPI